MEYLSDRVRHIFTLRLEMLRGKVAGCCFFTVFFLAVLSAETDDDIKSKENIYAAFRLSTISQRRYENLADKFKRSNYAVHQIDVFIGSENANWLASHVLRDSSDEIPLVVSSSSTSRDEYDASTHPRIENLILVYEDGGSVDIESVKSRFGYRWNSRARTIVCAMRTEGKTVLDILGYFWKHDLLNVALRVENEDSVTVENFIYNPFVPLESSGTRGILERLNPGDSMFPDKLNNLYNHTIPVSVFYHFPKAILKRKGLARLENGADVEVLWALSRKLNFNVELKTATVYGPSYTVYLPSGEQVGAIGDVLINRSEIVMTSQYMESTIGRRVEFTYPMLQNGYCVLVPKAKLMPMIVRMLAPFSIIIWTVTSGTLAALMLCLTLMRERNKFLKIIELLFYQRFQAGNRSRVIDRIFCISCIWWAYIMVCTYQANFVKLLIMPKYYKDLNSVQELYDSKLSLIVGDKMVGVLNNSAVPMFKKLAKRTVENLVFNDCVKWLLTYLNVSCAVDENVATVRVQKHLTTDNRPLLHKMRERLSLHWDVYVARHGFPFLDKFERYAQDLLQTGLYNKWMNDNLKKDKTQRELDETMILTVEHFEGIFIVLLIGLGISTAIFVLELGVSRVSFRVANSVTRTATK